MTHTEKLDQIIDEGHSIDLDGRTCASVALYMLQEYEKAMRKPRISIPTFKDWLESIYIS